MRSGITTARNGYHRVWIRTSTGGTVSSEAIDSLAEARARRAVAIAIQWKGTVAIREALRGDHAGYTG